MEASNAALKAKVKAAESKENAVRSELAQLQERARDLAVRNGLMQHDVAHLTSALAVRCARTRNVPLLCSSLAAIGSAGHVACGSMCSSSVWTGVTSPVPCTFALVLHCLADCMDLARSRPMNGVGFMLPSHAFP